jgi:hypothetical protein
MIKQNLVAQYKSPLEHINHEHNITTPSRQNHKHNSQTNEVQLENQRLKCKLKTDNRARAQGVSRLSFLIQGGEVQDNKEEARQKGAAQQGRYMGNRPQSCSKQIGAAQSRVLRGT